MKREELTELLTELADEDLEVGQNIYDHPCSVAIRAINKAFEDIEKLQKYVGAIRSGSKSKQLLVNLPYQPSW